MGDPVAETEEEIRSWALEYSRSKGWVLNPDEKQTNAVIKGLARNCERFGERYCPCRIRSGDKDKDKAIICPCEYHVHELEQAGHCTCNFFYDPEYL